VNAATLDQLRCPYCGGRLTLVESLWHEREGDEIAGGILGCHCCVFPVVDGIAVMHLEPAAKIAQQEIEAGRPDHARRAMFGFEDQAAARRFDAAAAHPEATYRELVEALGPAFEGGYFLYRFSDPTYVVAEAVVGAIGGAVIGDGGRAIDLCGGSGHLTRRLLPLSPAPPVLADLYFSKLWLARRFTAPGCEAVCCDGNGPLPFAPGTFRLAVCSDAFHYIWTKRLFAGEMMRLVGAEGAAVVTHAHNATQWNPSAGMPLPPDGYRDLFDTVEARLFPERALLDQIVAGGPIDLGMRFSAAQLDADPALTMVASERRDVFDRYPVPGSAAADAPQRRGDLRVNPLYAAEPAGDRVRLRLRFPSADYEDEYGAACRSYLPDEFVVDAAALAALASGDMPGALRELARRRVILELPRNYC
jgi:uncharacterized protein YbaR (Trm112 family)